MSTHIDLDSRARDFDKFPNPCDYIVETTQIGHWHKFNRMVDHRKQHASRSVSDGRFSVEVLKCIIPFAEFTYVNRYGDTQSGHTARLQKIYVDVHSASHDDRSLILSPLPVENSPSGASQSKGTVLHDRKTSAKFMLIRERILQDDGNASKWCVFSSNMDQVMGFKTREEIKVRFMQEDGYTIIINDGLGDIFNSIGGNTGVDEVNPLLQTSIMLKVTPYSRDDDYANHGVSTLRLQ